MARGIHREEHAVTAVLATIFMVGIAVSIAAVIAGVVLLNKPGTETTEPVFFKSNENQDRIQVAAAGVGSDWSRISLKAAEPGGANQIFAGNALNVANVPATNAGGDIQAAKLPVSLTRQPIITGDYVELCTDVDAADVVIDIIDTHSNVLLAKTRLLTVAAC